MDSKNKKIIKKIMKPGIKCLCDLCVRIAPMERRIRKALPKELRKDFDYLCMKRFTTEMDLDWTNTKLAGKWPGWEWIIEARRKAEKLDGKHKRLP